MRDSDVLFSCERVLLRICCVDAPVTHVTRWNYKGARCNLLRLTIPYVITISH